MTDSDTTVFGFRYRNKAFEGDESPGERNTEIRGNEPVARNVSDADDFAETSGKVAVDGSATRDSVHENAASTRGVENENSDEGFDDPPDGGWGWIVAIGALLCQVLVNIILSSFGILYSKYLLDLQTSALVSSWIYNSMGFIMMLSGVFLKAFVEEFGLRMTGSISTILTSIGISATAFANSPWFIMFFYSFVAGIGTGLLGCLSYGIVTYYFKRRIGIANAIMSSGVSTGQIIGPLLITRLQDHYAFQGSLLIMGAFYLNGLVGNMVFHPPEWHKKKPTALPRATKSGHSIAEVVLRILRNALKTLILIKSPVASIVAIGAAINLISYLNFLTALPFAMQEEGFSVDDAAYCLSLSGLASLVARLTISIVSDYSCMSKRYLYMGGTLTVSIFSVAFCFMPSLTFKSVAMGIWGGGVGVYMGLMNLIMIEFVGREQHMNVLSFNFFASSICFITSGPVLGFVRDVSGSYTYSLLCLAASTMFAFLMFLFLPAAQAYEKRNKEELENKNENV
ncbi:monocarboxylate transporter 12-B-like isoform X1 [Macrobrachium nipponense]|uniref:monocarboxylate transporter 12-B-like isoform X1 n=1 Tax=Macrobrachium nipponense TaxID=159736 RepID=UPI0030C83897